MTEREIISAKEISQILELSLPKVYDLLRQRGGIPARHVGNRYIVSRQQFNHWFHEGADNE